MSIFGSIMGAIFGHGSAQANASPTLAPGATPASAPPAQMVDVARGLSKHWHECRQNLPANSTANCAGNCVAGRSKAEVLGCPTGHIATDCASNDLDDEIDEHARHETLLTFPEWKFKS